MARTRTAGSRRWWRRPRAIVAIATVAVAVAGGTAAAVVLLTPRPAGERLEAASVGTFDQSVSASGTIEPATVASPTFSSAGTVTAVAVQVGQTVTAGQALASIDATPLQTQVALAQAELAQAQAQQSTAANGSSAQIAAAAAQVASAQAKLQLAQTAVTQATLVSPIAGVVAAVNVSVGEQVGASGGGSSAGSTRSSTSAPSSSATAVTSSSGAVTVMSPSSWIVDTTVGSADLATLKTGMQAQVTPTGAAQPLFGTVQSIGVASTSSTAGVAQFPVTIALTGSPTGLYAGTVARVGIVTKELDDVLTVPTAAVRSENGQTVVTVNDGGTDRTVAVTVGQIFGTQTQITQGLSEGQQIVVATSTTHAGSTGGSGVFGGTGGSGRGGGAGYGGSGRSGAGASSNGGK